MTTPRTLEAELLRGVLSTTAHDLGGLASALSLRADVLERDPASESSPALRRIANELRTLGTDVRAFRSAEGGDTLSPTKSGSLEQWLARIERFGRPILARGSTLSGNAIDDTVEPADALELTYITLAVLHQLASHWQEERVAVRVECLARGGNVEITLSATAGSVPLQLPGNSARNAARDAARDAARESVRDSVGEWWHWAMTRANASNIAMSVHEGRVCLRVPLLKRA